LGSARRFAWKQHRDKAPLSRLIEVAKTEGDRWGPIAAGLFGGSYERFEPIAINYLQEVSMLGWY